MDLGTYAGFALAFLVFAASPGPDNLTILSRTASDGAAHGIAGSAFAFGEFAPA